MRACEERSGSKDRPVMDTLSARLYYVPAVVLASSWAHRFEPEERPPAHEQDGKLVPASS